MLINAQTPQYRLSGGEIKSALKSKLRKGAQKTKETLIKIADFYVDGVNPLRGAERNERRGKPDVD